MCGCNEIGGGLRTIAISAFEVGFLNVQPLEGCVTAYDYHRRTGPWQAPRHHVVGRAERWI
jgi:hypothetical protein